MSRNNPISAVHSDTVFCNSSTNNVSRLPRNTMMRRAVVFGVLSLAEHGFVGGLGFQARVRPVAQPALPDEELFRTGDEKVECEYTRKGFLSARKTKISKRRVRVMGPPSGQKGKVTVKYWRNGLGCSEVASSFKFLGRKPLAGFSPEGTMLADADRGSAEINQNGETVLTFSKKPPTIKKGAKVRFSSVDTDKPVKRTGVIVEGPRSNAEGAEEFKVKFNGAKAEEWCPKKNLTLEGTNNEKATVILPAFGVFEVKIVEEYPEDPDKLEAKARRAGTSAWTEKFTIYRKTARVTYKQGEGMGDYFRIQSVDQRAGEGAYAARGLSSKLNDLRLRKEDDDDEDERTYTIGLVKEKTEARRDAWVGKLKSALGEEFDDRRGGGASSMMPGGNAEAAQNAKAEGEAAATAKAGGAETRQQMPRPMPSTVAPSSPPRAAAVLSNTATTAPTAPPPLLSLRPQSNWSETKMLDGGSSTKPGEFFGAAFLARKDAELEDRHRNRGNRGTAAA